MRPHLEEEHQIRIMIRKILSENSEEKQLLKETEANLYSTFVGPFVDVVNSVKLAGLDILSVLKLQFDVMTTLSPSKQKAAMAAYETRKAEIAKGWEPIEARNNAAFSDHAAPLAFMVAPHLALGAAFGKAGAKSVPGVVNYLDDAGWRLPLAGMIPGVQYDSMSDEKGASGSARKAFSAATSKDKGGLISMVKNTAKEMADIFFITHYAPTGPLLSEAEKKNDSPGPPWGIEGYEEKAEDMKPMSKAEFDKELDNYLEETGIKKELEKRAAQFVDNKKSHIEELMDAGEKQLAMIQALGVATNLEDFATALEEAKQLGLEVGDTSSVQPQMEEAAKTLVSEEEFIEQIKKEKKLKPEDEIPEEELLESAMTIVFMEAKKEIQAQLEEGLPKLQEQLKEAIMEDVPVKGEKNFKAISSTPAGRDYFKMIDAAIKQVEDYKIQA